MPEFSVSQPTEATVPLTPLAQFESLRERLDAVTLSPHRRAYAYHLLNTGTTSLQEGKTKLVEYCLLQLKIWLEDKEHRLTRVANPISPWARWDAHFIQTGLQKTRDLVERHGRLLTPMERRTYQGQLESATAGKAGFWAIRRAISVRLLRSRLNSLRPPSLQGNLPAYGDLPIGPYNHRMTLEGALRRIEDLDAGWVRDFLRIYTEGLTSVGNFTLDTSPAAAPVKATAAKRKVGSPAQKGDPGSNALSLALGD